MEKVNNILKNIFSITRLIYMIKSIIYIQVWTWFLSYFSWQILSFTFYFCVNFSFPVPLYTGTSICNPLVGWFPWKVQTMCFCQNMALFVWASWPVYHNNIGSTNNFVWSSLLYKHRSKTTCYAHMALHYSYSITEYMILLI